MEKHVKKTATMVALLGFGPRRGYGLFRGFQAKTAGARSLCSLDQRGGKLGGCIQSFDVILRWVLWDC